MTLDSAWNSSTSTERNQTIAAEFCCPCCQFSGVFSLAPRQWQSGTRIKYTPFLEGFSLAVLLYVGELMSVKRINCLLSILLWAVNQIESWPEWCLAWAKKLSILKINSSASKIQFGMHARHKCWILDYFCDYFSLYICTNLNYSRQFNYVFTLLRWCFHQSFYSDIMAWPLADQGA